MIISHIHHNHVADFDGVIVQWQCTVLAVEVTLLIRRERKSLDTAKSSLILDLWKVFADKLT